MSDIPPRTQTTRGMLPEVKPGNVKAPTMSWFEMVEEDEKLEQLEKERLAQNIRKSDDDYDMNSSRTKRQRMVVE